MSVFCLLKFLDWICNSIKDFDFDTKTKDVPVAFAELIPAMIKRMEAHLWYLNESLVKVSEFDKEKCRRAMLQNKTASQNTIHKMGKLVTPTNISKNTKLCQLFGPDSLLIPTQINANIDFLEEPVKDWLKEQSYISLKTILNDPSPCEIHNKFTKNSGQKSALYQTIPELRKVIQDCRKSSLLNAELLH